MISNKRERLAAFIWPECTWHFTTTNYGDRRLVGYYLGTWEVFFELEKRNWRIWKAARFGEIDSGSWRGFSSPEEAKKSFEKEQEMRKND